ncbi:MAG TPA: ABC transporter permease [Candidatus Acidoferrales bacterium]|nr:ABC transporter permease [Candidatus Acidoferrales bacterium]
MGKFWQDLQYGARMLWKSPAFTLIAMITLALGIGANSALFSLVNAVVLRPMPFPKSQQLVIVWETDANRKITRGTAPPADFLDWRSQNQVFQGMAAYELWMSTITGGSEPEQLWGAHVSPSMFSMLGVKMSVGGGFRPDEEQPGHDQVVILSHNVWEDNFGSDPNITARTILIDGKPYKVAGVLPPHFSLFGLNRSPDLWMPLAFPPAEIRRDNASLVIFARLKDGVTLAQANADMSAIARRLAAEYPDTNQSTGAHVALLQTEFGKTIGDALLILLAAAGVVLLIACSNVANLMLTRSAGRQREIAIRSALGARRTRLMRQLLTESILLGLLGGALGLLFAYGAIRLLPLLLPATGSIGEIPHANGLGINLPVLAFTFVVAILTGIIFGLAPAFQSSRTELTESLKESGRGSSAGRQSRSTRNSLVVVEIGMSLVLLVGAGTLLRGLSALLNANLGFNPENVLSFQVWLPDSHYATASGVRGFFNQAIAKMRAIPGVKSAGAINFLPLTGWTDLSNFDISGRPSPPPKEEFVAHYRVIDPGYFSTMQMPLLKGRDFSAADGENAQPVVIISEALAKKYWPNENPVGQQIRLHLQQSKAAPYRPAVSSDWTTIVGVVSNLQEREFIEHQLPLIYFPSAQVPSRIMRFVLRTSVPPDSLAASARQAVFSLDKNQPVTEMKSLHELRSETVSREELNAKLLTFFALLALALAAIGIYGVISYGVEQRTHEIGIRMALGARPSDVVRLIVREGFRLILVGIALGLAGAYALTNVLAGFLFGVKSIDLPSILLGIAILVIFALLACYVPARRATRVDPLNSLRYE